MGTNCLKLIGMKVLLKITDSFKELIQNFLVQNLIQYSKTIKIQLMREKVSYFLLFEWSECVFNNMIMHFHQYIIKWVVILLRQTLNFSKKYFLHSLFTFLNTHIFELLRPKPWHTLYYFIHFFELFTAKKVQKCKYGV